MNKHFTPSSHYATIFIYTTLHEIGSFSEILYLIDLIVTPDMKCRNLIHINQNE